MKKIAALIAVIFILGCNTDVRDQLDSLTGLDTSGKEIVETVNQSVNTQPQYSNYDLLEGNDREILMGSFNVQVYGKTKASKPEVMEVLDIIISQYDLLAFQEIRDSDDIAFPQLMSRLEGYEYVISERLGRTSSKEQYAFIYNPDKITFHDDAQYPDEGDLFEREPYLARFSFGNETYILINIHTKPDDTESEITHLKEVVDFAKETWYNETNIIVLGDLNADCSYFNSQLKSAKLSMHWVIPDTFDTTTKSTDCAYDRFIVSDELIDNLGEYGVDRFDLKLKLDMAATNAVSDHFPIYLYLK